MQKSSKGGRAMRRATGIFVALLVILGGVAIGVGAYNAGVSHGLTQAGHASQIVRVVGPSYGFFPFGFLLFPLVFFGILFLIRGAFWRRRWDGGHDHPHAGPAGWWEGRAQMFEDWHRRQHDQGSANHPGSGGEPAHV
jgi:hypothetical protein